MPESTTEVARTVALRRDMAQRVATADLGKRFAQEQALAALGLNVSTLAFYNWLIVSGHDPEFTFRGSV
ncbi:MAG: hypothetical protein ACYDAG_16015 [Chloroflexota bacterium]